jgi:hypothetical protein
MTRDGILVRVSTPIENGAPAVTFWIVAVTEPNGAEQIVKQKVSQICLVEATLIPVLPDTLKRLGLAHGEAWLL